ncbi:hypothetical protein SGRA_3802 [Saprospira grandis str. Lewin]|uniref:Uncharacterized protein n=1 Tax=Saprospira grandis (strain Lewin) TaxID=984262 RepID=H6L8F4_SAPGL|nr:hypothetical protein SGRA_3802 [Saprospira grandis str. Lewin]
MGPAAALAKPRRPPLCCAARRSARPFVFFRFAQKNLVWPTATAAQRWAAQLFFFFGLLSSAVSQFWAHGLKPMLVGLCKLAG